MTRGGGPARLALANAAGLNLGMYRSEHVEERVRRAIERERVADELALARRLGADANARTRFRRSVAVSVTGLFRDPAQFDLLEELLSPLLSDGRRLGVWSAGCADGSELYTVGMLLERLAALDRSLLLGSDLLDENLAIARRGVYGDVRIPDTVRARVRWEKRDIVSAGAPGGSWRLILCRNVAIYLTPEAKRTLHETLAAALAPGGVLLLGRSERIAVPADLGLEPAGRNAYRRRQ